MAEPRSSPYLPALVGGIAAGVLSSVPLLSCFCCLWIIGGAMLSANLYAKGSSVSLTPGDGAIVGIFCGIAAAVAASFVNLAFQPANREIARRFADQLSQMFPNVAPEWDAALRGSTQGVSLAMFLFGVFVQAVVFAVLGALGGVIGASLFGRKATPPVQSGPAAPGIGT
jgi:hypothetical protein